MTCNGCVRHVESALRTLPGVSAVEVSLPDQCAKIVHDPAQSPVISLIAVVQDAGYTAAAE